MCPAQDNDVVHTFTPLCQRTSVSGRMIVRTLRIAGNQRYSWIKNKQSFRELR